MWKKSFTSRFTSNDFICRQFFDGAGGCCCYFLRCSLVYIFLVRWFRCTRTLACWLASLNLPQLTNKLNYVGYDSWSGFSQWQERRDRVAGKTHAVLFGLRWSFLYSFGAVDSILKPLDNVRRINFVRFFRYAFVFSVFVFLHSVCVRRIDFSKWNLIR